MARRLTAGVGLLRTALLPGVAQGTSKPYPTALGHATHRPLHRAATSPVPGPASGAAPDGARAVPRPSRGAGAGVRVGREHAPACRVVVRAAAPGTHGWASRCRAVVPGRGGRACGPRGLSSCQPPSPMAHRAVPAWGVVVGGRGARDPASVPSPPTRRWRRRATADVVWQAEVCPVWPAPQLGRSASVRQVKSDSRM